MELKEENIRDLKDENFRLKEELDYEMFSAREAFRIVVESNLDAIIGIDNNCNIILLNPAGEDLFQYVEKEIIHKPIEILFKENVKEEYHDKLIKFLNEGIFERDLLNKTTEILFKKRDGNYFEGETSFAVGRGKTNLYIVLTIRDISVKKKIERELVESEAKARTLLNTPHQSIVLIDQNGKIIDCNQSCLQLWNSKQNEVIDRNIAAFVNSESSNDILIKIKWVFSSSEILRYETKSNNEYFDNIIYPVIDKDEKVVQVVLVINNITDFQKEQHLSIPDNTISLNQCILSELNHEIRTPIAGMIGMLSMLNQENLNYEQKEYISIIKESSESLLNLFQNFFDLFLLQKNKIQLSVKPFNIYKKLTDFISTQAIIAKSNHIDLNIEFQQGFPETIYIDEQRYNQTLSNLLKQAIRFTNNGKVLISLSMLDDTQSTYIKTKIDCSNILIKEEEKNIIAKIFTNKDFTKFSPNNFPETEYYVARMLTELMEGTIGITNYETNSFTFWFTSKAKNS